MQLHLENIFSKRILISPLDWGMGHTTRCIALIRRLIDQENVIFFAGNEDQCAFVKREFNEVHFLFAEGYCVTLDSQKSPYWQMLNQFSKIKKAIQDENKLAEKYAVSENIDVIISDNRYGFFSGKTRNIFLAHQLNLQLPYFRSFVNRQLKKWIEKFDCIWIPDDPQKPICGDLLQANFKIPKRFIGHLCRFKRERLSVAYDYLGIVSGPEPERTRFTKILVDHLLEQNKKVALVGSYIESQRLTCFEDPSTKELEELINSSACIISRAGYTTIMEMIVLQKEAILIPTPGQFEQEYLAGNIHFEFLKFIPESQFEQKL